MQQIFDELDADEKINNLIKDVMMGKSEKMGYSVVSGRLLYKNRLVLPRESQFIPHILKEYHDRILGGHSGILKTIKRIQQLFHWSKMKDDVKKHIAECNIFQTHKYSTLNQAGLLQPIPLPSSIWSEISMDFIEGLPKSKSVNVILVVVD